MAHSANIISKIQLPNGSTYEVHDLAAVHTLADLAALGLEFEGAFIYKGVVATVEALGDIANPKTGWVYHVTADESEYVWNGTEWEEFGHHFLVNHTHNFSGNISASINVEGANTPSSVSGSATVTGTNAESVVTGTNKASSVSGTATVTGVNADSDVTASGSVAVPKVTTAAKYIKATNSSNAFVTSYPGATSKLAQTSITPAGTATSVINSVTPTTGSITGVSGSTKASKATAGTAVAVAKAGTAVSIPNVTANSSVTASKLKTAGSSQTGTAVSSWSASVDANGVLSFSAPTASYVNNVTMPTFEDVSATNTTLGTAISVTPAVENGAITPYTFTDVTVPKAAADATTVVTEIATGTTNAATVGTAVTVATGALSETGTGATVMTGLGTAKTATALTSVSLAEGTSTDGIFTGDDVSVGSENKTVNVTGTAEGQVWTQSTGTISGTAEAQEFTGTAAAQTWTQSTGTISGTAAAQKWTATTETVTGTISGTTGGPVEA